MIKIDFEPVLQLLISRVDEYGRYSAYDALRDYIEEEIIDGLEDATDTQIESFIHSQFEPLKTYLFDKTGHGLKIGKDLTCTKAEAVKKQKERGTSEKSAAEFDVTILDKKLTDLTKSDVSIIETQSLKAEKEQNFELAFKGFEKLRAYYELIERNKSKSLSMLRKKANASKELNRADTYKYFSDYADLLTLVYKHNEAGIYYEKAYYEIKSTNTNVVSDRDIKAVDLLRKARLQFNAAGDNRKASKLFILENEEERKRTGSKVKYFYKILSNYGESPVRVACWIVGVILSFALIYYCFDINVPSKTSLVCTIENAENILSRCVEDEANDTPKQHPLTYVYFSTVTFTTLGYGDYSPLEGLSRGFASFQAMLGLILSSLFIVTFVRRFSR